METKTKKSAKTSAKNPHAPWVVGGQYIIRTVTMTITGRLSYVGDKELELDEAAWIACSHRWADTLATGALDEVEPFPGAAIVGRGSIVDAAAWAHPLPRTQK